MKYFPLRYAALTAAALFLCSCVSQSPVSAFDESAFAPFQGSGSCTVKGIAFTILKDNQESVAGEGAIVKLMPANAYTDEIVQKVYASGRNPGSLDPRLAKYTREVHPAHGGGFAFHNVPPGDYYVSSHLNWGFPQFSTDSDGNSVTTEGTTDQWIYARVSLKSGQTVNVQDWSQGK